LGAITHQALAMRRKTQETGRSFVGRYRSVEASLYCNTVVLLFLTVALLGALLYPSYRTVVRPFLEMNDLRTANGAFEIKEHFAALGLLMLPLYWAAWNRPDSIRSDTRRAITWILASIVWCNFLIGHVLNNIRGFFQ
jgi:hypothetical protein